MKKIFSLLLVAISIGTAIQAQNFILHIKNNAHMDLMYGNDVEYGLGVLPPGQIAKDQTLDLYFNPNVLTGVEGYLHIFPLGQPEQKTDIYYDNPLIGTGTYSVWSSSVLLCKPVKWAILSNTGADCELTVEIYNPGSGFGKAIPVALNKSGVIKGSVLWDKNNITSPETTPFGNAFVFKVTAPTQFVESNGPFILEKAGTYNGKQGYFQGNKPTGTVSYETVQSFNPNYVEIRYTITGIPTDVPVEMDITTDLQKAKWIAGPQKIKPGEDYVFVVGAFPEVNKSNLTINNGLAQLNGVDFACDGDWMKIDADGKIIGGGAMVNKIAARKSVAVLPNSTIALNSAAKTSATGSSMVQVKAAAQNAQAPIQAKQIQGAAAQKIRIKQ
ncbi:MAG: hypothetical protein JST86_13840 [Bacteroidetes bacterium]|nr:hypothetical protein [Bacteroidota bacterium]